MTFLQSEHSVLARFDLGDRYPDTFVELARSLRLRSGTVSAIGAVQNVELAYYDLPRREYLPIPVAGVVELVSFAGNLTALDGVPFYHVHAVVGDRDGQLLGGHLMKFEVALSVECRIDLLHHTIGRERDERTGLNLLKLP